MLIGETIVVSLLHLRQIGGSWHYFRSAALTAARTGSATGGLHLYHFHPQFQFGPVAVLLSWPFAALPPPLGLLAATSVMAAAGLFVMHLLRRLVQAVPGTRPATFLASGILFVPVWAELAIRAGHIDDVTALACAVAAVVAVSRRPLLAAVLLAVAAGSKPWALAFAPLLLAAPPGRRAVPFVVWLVLVAAPWVPFIVADPGSVAVTHFTIANAPDSALRALGADDARTPPWCRPAQALLGAGVAALLARRRHGAHVLLAGIASRLLLDPQTYSYYTAGLIVATIAVDLTRRARVPWYTLAAVGLVYVPQYIHGGLLADPDTHGALRAGFLLVILALLVVAGLRPDHGPRGGVGSTDPAPASANRAVTAS